MDDHLQALEELPAAESLDRVVQATKKPRKPTVVVDAKPDAVKFYEKLGFFALDVESGELRDRPLLRSMFLELGAIPKP